MAEVRRTRLPGVGVLHSFVTDDGGTVGVIAHRSGRSDLVTFAERGTADPAKVSLRLSEDEAHTLAELLGGTSITESLAALGRIPGLAIDWFGVEEGDRVAGFTLGELPDRGITGVTVVAVVRDDRVDPAPDASLVFRAGDTLVVAGSPDRVESAFAAFRAPASHDSAPPGS